VVLVLLSLMMVTVMSSPGSAPPLRLSW